MKAYLAGYGCYLESVEFKLLSDASEEDLIKSLYERAIEATEGWVGMHGFADEEYEDFDSQEAYEEYTIDAVENAVEYYLYEWNEEKHMGRVDNSDEPEVWA